MIGGKGNSSVQPTALGSMIQSSTYGQTIPTPYGLVKTPLLPIWAQNLRKGGSSKKFKQKKKGQPTYIENVDFLIGHNPLLGICQAWSNSTKLPLVFTSVGVAVSSYGPQTITISDAHFYAVIGVTVDTTYSETFNDYGSPGSQSFSGTFETPLWNSAFIGPDPTNSSVYRNWPYVYEWTPQMGNTIYLPMACGGPFGNPIVAPYNITIYYAQLASTLRYTSPSAYLRLTFEPTLADGPEYGSTYAAQQVLMPPYAGAGSATYDLGSAGAIPDNRVEVQGAFAVYPTGDVDFADIIEDMIKSGISQVSPADTSGTMNAQAVQHGVSAFDFPGAVQKKIAAASSNTIGPHGALAFDQPNVAGNKLLVFWSGSGGTSIPTVSDDAGNTWNIIDNGQYSSPAASWCIAWATAKAWPAGNTVTFASTAGATGIAIGISELAGVDTFDTSVAETLSAAVTNNLPLTTGNAQGQPAMVFAFSINLFTPPTGADPTWNDFMFSTVSAGNYVQTKNVTSPTTVTLNNQITGQINVGKTRLVLVSFILVAPATTPQPFGNFLDEPSMQICRNQARAYGLWGALSPLSQKACRDWLKDLYSSMNSAPFYSGGVLKQMPYGEVSAVGNGAVYVAPTASGPIANLSDLNGDFLGDSSEPPVTVERSAQFDAPDILQYQILSRGNDYNPVTVSQPEPGSLALYGVRKAAPETHDEIKDPDIARVLLGIATRRQAFIRNNLKFKLGPKAILYEPMDLVTLTETQSAISLLPARFTSLEISDKWDVDCETEPYVYGTHGPNPITATSVTPFVPNPVADPGDVNTPILFEPVPRLYGSQSQAQLWGMISAISPNYAGCYAFVSTDGGSSYNPIQNLATGNSAIVGNGVTGVTTSDWPSHADPDTANSLPLDLTESLGTLASYSAADRDNFTYPCYVAGGNANIPYGLMTYNSAVLTGTNLYTLNAMGTGNELRRCVYGAPAVGTDVDHPSGSRFAFLGNPAQPNAPGLMKLTMDPKWIGVTLYFKFLPFNTFGNTVEDLSAVTAYTFTPSGLPGGGISQNQSYTQSPSIALTQPTGTTVAMAQVTTSFGTNSVKYNARTLSITNPSVPTTYYVTIADTGYVGDTGSGTNLTATIQTSTALVGVPGNTFIGFIIAVPGGGATAVAAPGGWPEPQSAIVTT